ncbi:unnamed protein product [Toxocara canis]|uniref:RNA-binding protein Nova-1 n=1 Tax=Toxocara canis TaxID=6265 RepID=A0A183V4E6_TOXCA|nr:unnamed protein product [Toxocara canis]
MGEPQKVQTAVRMVEDILMSRDGHHPAHRYGVYQHPIGGAQQAIGEVKSVGASQWYLQVIVPRESVGMIIGKRGEMIKRIAEESGAKIQFKPDDDNSAPHRNALIEGTAEQIEKATRLISEVIHRTGANDRGDLFHMHVAASKAGLVIGRGGENIKQVSVYSVATVRNSNDMCADSGAHIELSREPPPNTFEKIFIIKGSPQQIHHAQHLIRIKVEKVLYANAIFTVQFWFSGDSVAIWCSEQNLSLLFGTALELDLRAVYPCFD